MQVKRNDGIHSLYPRMSSASRSLTQRARLLTILPRNLRWSSRNNTFFASHLPHLENKSWVVLSGRPVSTKSSSPLSPERKTLSAYAHARFEEGNSPYVANFEDKGKLAIPPAKRLIIGTFCYLKGGDICALRLT